MTLDILALARECGITADSPWGDEFMCTASSAAIAAFGNAIIERCAAVCDERAMADALLGKLRNLSQWLDDEDDSSDNHLALLGDLVTLLPEIVAALERDAQDAARYRWLLDTFFSDSNASHLIGRCNTPAELDEAIDRAIKDRT